MISAYKVRFDFLMTTLWVYLCSFIFALLGGYLVIFITFGLEVLGDWGFLVGSTVWMQIVLVAASPIAALLICMISKTTFSEQAITGRSFWGAKIRIQWQEITEIGSNRFFGVQFVKIVTAPDRPVLWFGLSFDQKAELLSYMTRSRHPYNKLVTFLKD